MQAPPKNPLQHPELPVEHALQGLVPRAGGPGLAAGGRFGAAIRLVVCGWLAAGCDGPMLHHPAVGRAVAPLPVVSIADRAAPPPSFAGRVTLLNFWGTWCPPCRRELPGLARLAARLAAEPRFQLVAVSCAGGPEDLAEVRSQTREFVREHDLAIEPWAFADPVGRQEVFERLGLDAFPTTYLLGPDGRVRQVWRGYRTGDEAEIARAVVEALKGS